MLKFIFLTFTLCSNFYLTGCLNQMAGVSVDSNEVHVDYDIDFLSFYKDILKLTHGRNLFRREDSLHGKVVFSKILNLDIEDFEEKKVGQRKLFIFPPFSKEKVNLIISKIPKELYHSGYEIFSPTFWVKLQKYSQSKDFSVGFIEYLPGKTVNGLYNSYYKVIGLDSLSLIGTLEHEVRHYDQHLKKNKKSHQNLIFENKSCQKDMRRVFAELDASSFDLKFLKNLISSIETSFLSSILKKDETFSLLLFSKIKVSLSYPEEVLVPLKYESECSDKMKDVAGKILDKIQPDLNYLFNLLKKIEKSIRKELRIIKSQCDLFKKKVKECARWSQQAILTEKLKSDFEERLRNIVAARYQVIQETLLELPENYLDFLMRDINGVMSIMEEGINDESQ